MRHQLVRDAEQNLSDVLLLTDGQVLPQLMGRNQAVGLGRRRTGAWDSHRCCLLAWHGGCHESHAAIVQQRGAKGEWD